MSKLIKIGNSHGLVVPIEILRALKIERGDFVIYGFQPDGSVCFRKVTDIEIQKFKTGQFL